MRHCKERENDSVQVTWGKVRQEASHRKLWGSFRAQAQVGGLVLCTEKTGPIRYNAEKISMFRGEALFCLSESMYKYDCGKLDSKLLQFVLR